MEKNLLTPQTSIIHMQRDSGSGDGGWLLKQTFAKECAKDMDKRATLLNFHSFWCCFYMKQRSARWLMSRGGSWRPNTNSSTFIIGCSSSYNEIFLQPVFRSVHGLVEQSEHTTTPPHTYTCSYKQQHYCNYSTTRRGFQYNSPFLSPPSPLSLLFLSLSLLAYFLFLLSAHYSDGLL